jgi:hypothetical protein
MKLSGHSYDNAVFDSLLDGLSGDVVLKRANKNTEQPAISGTDVFSSTTEDTLRQVQADHLDFIAKELQFAADRAKVAISQEDLATFAKQAIDEGLRGKKLERAAQRFCNQLDREVAPPQGTMRNAHSPSLLDETTNDHAVIPAGYDPEHGQNDTRTGGYMGMSKNPNSIWDTEAMQRLAQKKHGDEQIKESKEAQKQFRDDQKRAFWQGLQDSMSDPNVIKEKAASVANVSTVESPGGNQNLPANSMSVFSNDRDFSNIPEQTQGEKLAEAVEARASKKAEAKEEWNQVKPATKADNSLESLLNKNADEVPARQNTHRAAVDRLFEGLIDQGLIQ